MALRHNGQDLLPLTKPPTFSLHLDLPTELTQHQGIYLNVVQGRILTS